MHLKIAFGTNPVGSIIFTLLHNAIIPNFIESALTTQNYKYFVKNDVKIYRKAITIWEHDHFVH